MLNHEVRRKGIGGSDVATIMWQMRPKLRKKIHLFAHQTPLGLWDYITYGVRMRENASQSYGKIMESIIIDDYEKRNEIILTRDEPVIDKKNPLFRGNLDAIYKPTPLPFEAKTARTTEGWGMKRIDIIPSAYALQCLHYGAITDSPHIDVGVKFEGRDEVQYYHVPRNLKLESTMRDVCAEWWETHIVQNKKPDPINQFDQDTFVDIGRVSAPDDILELYEQYSTLDKKLAKEWKEKEKIKEQINLWAKKNIKEKSLVLFPDGTQLGRLYFSTKYPIQIDLLKGDNIDVDKYKQKKTSVCFKLS